MSKIFEIALPEYHVREKPDHACLGAKIDPVFRQNFIGQEIVVRCLGSQEHPGLGIDELLAVILKTGTDRYDPARRGDRYENIEGKHIDFFALAFKVTHESEIMQQFIEPFYQWPLKDTGVPVRIDIAIIYDPDQLERVIHTYSDGRTKDDGFIFKNPSRKQDAIKGIIKIL